MKINYTFINFQIAKEQFSEFTYLFSSNITHLVKKGFFNFLERNSGF